jgi:enolase-phosphatase E1
MTLNSIDVVLLDIEGTTSSIAFVYDIMFPFVRKHVLPFLNANSKQANVLSSIRQMACDAGLPDENSWRNNPAKSFEEAVTEHVLDLMDRDSKTTGLKALQGLIWESGFQSGELRAHLFPDCFPAIKRWKDLGKTLAIYSSGSVVAQKLFFGHTEFGDLRPYFTAHFDTTVGGKRESASYSAVATQLGFAPSRILFLSDVAAELEAANQAGMQAIAVVRPGNAPLPDTFSRQRVSSFDEILCD